MRMKLQCHSVRVTPLSFCFLAAAHTAHSNKQQRGRDGILGIKLKLKLNRRPPHEARDADPASKRIFLQITLLLTPLSARVDRVCAVLLSAAIP